MYLVLEEIDAKNPKHELNTIMLHNDLETLNRVQLKLPISRFACGEKSR